MLDAGSELLAERGWASFTLAEVSRRAGVSNGSIYWRVDGKDALLAAIHERFIADMDAETAPFMDRDHWARMGAEEAIAHAVALLTGTFRQNRRLLRAIILWASSDAAASERGAKAVRRAARRFENALTPVLERAGHPDPLPAARFVHRLLFSALTARITWPEQELGRQLSWKAFEEQLANAAKGYLLPGA